MRLKKFHEYITEEDVTPAGVSNTEDTEIDSTHSKYLKSKGEKCPRCEEKIEKCCCQESDSWSTNTYHRVPKGKKILK